MEAEESIKMKKEMLQDLSMLKVKLKTERHHSQTATDKELNLMCEYFNNVSKIDEFYHLGLLSEKFAKQMEKSYYDVLCERALTNNEISRLGKFSGTYAKQRMIRDSSFVDNLLSELKENRHPADLFDSDRGTHGNLIKLSDYAAENFREDNITEAQYAGIMTTLLRFSKDILHSRDGQFDRPIREGCTRILGEISKNMHDFCPYPELATAYINLEQEYVNNYQKYLQSQRGDLKFPQTQSNIVNNTRN